MKITQKVVACFCNKSPNKFFFKGSQINDHSIGDKRVKQFFIKKKDFEKLINFDSLYLLNY